MTGNEYVTDRSPWRKSSYCGAATTACVEAAALPGAVAVRDSKNPAGPALRFATEEWAAFVCGLRAGEFAG